jgi:hypothetical protein
VAQEGCPETHSLVSHEHIHLGSGSGSGHRALGPRQQGTLSYHAQEVMSWHGTSQVAVPRLTGHDLGDISALSPEVLG